MGLIHSWKQVIYFWLLHSKCNVPRRMEYIHVSVLKSNKSCAQNDYCIRVNDIHIQYPPHIVKKIPIKASIVMSSKFQCFLYTYIYIYFKNSVTEYRRSNWIAEVKVSILISETNSTCGLNYIHMQQIIRIRSRPL